MKWMLVQSLINGILSGGVYSLIAVGITIIFGVMRIVNFASGSFMMLGMYLAWYAYDLTGYNTYWLTPFVVAGTGVVAYVTYRLTLLPILNKPRTSSIIVTVGISFVLQNLVLLIFGMVPFTVPCSFKNDVLVLGKYMLGVPRLIAFCVALTLTAGVTMLLRYTRFGRHMRATAENQQISEMLGVNTKLIYISAWTLGIVLTAVAGLLLTPLYFVESSVGQTFRSVGLIAVVLGGLGDIRGAFLSGLFLGVVESVLGTLISPYYGLVGIFICFLVILNFKPHGLFGKGERVA